METVKSQIIRDRLYDMVKIFSADKILLNRFWSACSKYHPLNNHFRDNCYFLLDLSLYVQDAKNKNKIDTITYKCLNSSINDLKSIMLET